MIRTEYFGVLLRCGVRLRFLSPMLDLSATHRKWTHEREDLCEFESHATHGKQRGIYGSSAADGYVPLIYIPPTSSACSHNFA
jgi:hypothetical protein